MPDKLISAFQRHKKEGSPGHVNRATTFSARQAVDVWTNCVPSPAPLQYYTHPALDTCANNANISSLRRQWSRSTSFSPTYHPISLLPRRNKRREKTHCSQDGDDDSSRSNDAFLCLDPKAPSSAAKVNMAYSAAFNQGRRKEEIPVACYRWRYNELLAAKKCPSKGA